MSEDAASLTLLGSPVVVNDPDVGDNLVYFVDGGDGAAKFACNVTTGQIYVKDGAQLDYETRV